VARIFEPHVRGTADVAGAGLGLSIARGIVRAHGGWLDVTSTPTGAAFLAVLPTEPPDEAAWSVVAEAGEPHVV